MSSTEAMVESPDQVSADEMAAAIFDEVVIPLAETLRARGRAPAFARAGDATAASYFEPPELGVMQPCDFDFPGGGDISGLLEAVADYWRARGDVAHLALIPGLMAVAGKLGEEAMQSDGEVDILCYTMF